MKNIINKYTRVYQLRAKEKHKPYQAWIFIGSNYPQIHANKKFNPQMNADKHG